MVDRITVLLALTVLSTNAWSDSGDQYWFFSVGNMAVSENNVADLSAVGVTYGRGLTNRLAVEIEGHSTTQGGKYSTDVKIGNYKIIALGGYLVHREAFAPSLYGKIKGGFLLERIEISDDDSNTSATTNSVEGSGGVGVGWSISTGELSSTMEFEATMLEKQVILYSIGLSLYF